MITPVIRMLAHKNSNACHHSLVSPMITSLLQSNVRTPGILVVTMVLQANPFHGFNAIYLSQTRSHTFGSIWLSTLLTPVVEASSSHIRFVVGEFLVQLTSYVLLAPSTHVDWLVGFSYWLSTVEPIGWLLRLAPYTERCKNPDFGRTSVLAH